MVVLTIALVFLFVLGGYALYYWFLFSGFPIAADDSGALIGIRSGTFGDAFGTLNALFSGLAFAGVVVTLYLQRKDIKNSQEQVERQQVEAARQQEESQFYNMLGLQQSVVRGFDVVKIHFDTIGNTTRPDSITGRDCFRTWALQLKRAYKELENALDDDDVDFTIDAYDLVWNKHRGDLSIYFRSLYSLFKFCSRCKYADSRWLGTVVRSLISDYELVMIFYNCLSLRGAKFKNFANEFALFDNLDPKLLLSISHVLRLDREAYGRNEDVLKIFANSDS